MYTMNYFTGYKKLFTEAGFLKQLNHSILKCQICFLCFTSYAQFQLCFLLYNVLKAITTHPQQPSGDYLKHSKL